MINAPKIKKILRPDGRFTPTFYRMRDHVPEPGLGGSHWMVRFAGKEAGEVFSTWDHEHDVHWRVNDQWARPITDTHGRPLVFESRADAANHLIRLLGYRGEYDPPAKHERAY